MDLAHAAAARIALSPALAEPPASLTDIVLDAMRDPRVNLDRLQVLLRCAVLASMREAA